VADTTVIAVAKDLDGKHYGTDVVIRHPSGRKASITVWLPFDDPSDEELAGWNADRSMWESNVQIPDGWGGTEPIQSVFPADNHYQSQFESAVVKRIVDALDGWDYEEARRG